MDVNYFSIKLGKSTTKKKDIHCADLRSGYVDEFCSITINTSRGQLNFWISASTICDWNSVYTHTGTQARTHTQSHFQRRTCNVYILATISELNIGTSGVINKNDIVLSGKSRYIKEKKWMGNKLNSRVLQVRNFNKQIFAFLLKRETNSRSLP